MAARDVMRSISGSEVPCGPSHFTRRLVSWSVGSSDFLKVGTTKAAPITSTPIATNAGIGVRTTGANTAA